MPVTRNRAAAAAGAAALVAAVALTLGACSSSGSTNSPPQSTDATPSMTQMPSGSTPSGEALAPATAGTITISNFLYEVPVSAQPGETITVHNNDSVEHSVTADDGSFSVDIPANGTATFTAPAQAGTFAFHCTYHPQMHGTLIVS